MIISKKKFQEMFEYKYLSDISYLLKKGTIIANDDGLIDLEDKKNKKWVKSRKIKLSKKESSQIKEQELETKTQGQNQETEGQIGLEIDVLNQRISNQKLIDKRTQLLEIKIAKESKELIPLDVVKKHQTVVFGELFKNIANSPSVYMSDIFNIFKADKTPKETAIKFFTEKLLAQLERSIKNAESKLIKLYEQD